MTSVCLTHALYKNDGCTRVKCTTPTCTYFAKQLHFNAVLKAYVNALACTAQIIAGCACILERSMQMQAPSGLELASSMDESGPLQFVE